MALSLQERGKYVVLGEVNIVVTALRRNIRWTTHNYQSDHEDPLISSFNFLKNDLNRCNDLSDLEPSKFLTPFLEVIRSEDTTGPITGLALSSINKFLSYTLIDTKSTNVAMAVSSMADAVTHARFVGTDPANDEVVLMKILQVLRMLLLTSIGVYLTNEAVCEIMQSCFRICFEMRLSELLRKSAEHTLVDMVQVLFTRIPQFKEDIKNPTSSSMKKLKMRAGGMGDTNTRGKRQKRSNKNKKNDQRKMPPSPQVMPMPEDQPISTNPSFDVANEVPFPGSVSDVSDLSSKVEQEQNKQHAPGEKIEDKEMNKEEEIVTTQQENDEGEMADTEMSGEKDENCASLQSQDSIVEGQEDFDAQSQVSESSSIQDVDFSSNSRGVRFTASPRQSGVSGPLVPYSLPCVRELFRFLISLTNPHDRHNSDVMMHMGMSLLTVALEVSRDQLSKYPSLLILVKDDMCRYLFQLLSVDRLGLIASSLRVSLLLFESLRQDLKFQLEQFLRKLMDLITSDNPKLPYEVKELSIDAVVQLWHIPGFVTELYLNYDCDFYCSSMFEDLSKLLSKNAFPVSGLYTTHLLSLEALLTVVKSVEYRCNQREATTPNPDDLIAEHIEPATPPPTPMRSVPSWPSNMSLSGQQLAEQLQQSTLDASVPAAAEKAEPKIPKRFSGALPTIEELQTIKQKKKIIQTGTELFNQKPKKGISYLQEQNLLAVPLDAREVSKWLRANPWLDKKMIGEYISDRRHPEILDNFVSTFKFEGLRVDESLRMYLETFRLPGEAPVIQRLIEAFSAYWSECNHHPFMNLDAAFTLSYAIIMLNTDQHNTNVRKQNEPMTVNDFKRNVKGCNGKGDFDQHMLEEIYSTIRNDEIVLPDEQTGPVRDRWLWNVSLRRGSTAEGLWLRAPSVNKPGGCEALHIYDRDLFAMNWGPTVSALSYVFDKSLDETIIQQAITGYRKCALISAHFGMSDVFDNLIVSLCKFTALANTGESPEATAVIFGSNGKSQLAARTAFALSHRHGDILREGWRNIFDIILPLYRAKLLPTAMVEVEDFVDPTGRISLIREELPMQRSDSSIFSSFYQFMTGPADNSNQKQTAPEDEEATKYAQECVKDLQLETLVTESKFLRLDSLQEMIKALMQASRGPLAHESMGTSYSEDSAIFFLELLLRVVLQNRDRILSLWQPVRDHLYAIIVMATEYSLLMERTVVGLLRMAIRLLHREDVADEVLASLQILLMIKPGIIPKVSRQIGYGLHELLRTNAANIHSRDDWITIFTVMKCVGAGAVPPPIVQVPSTPELPQAHSDEAISVSMEDDACVERKTHSDSETTSLHESVAVSDRGYTSDSELYENHLPSTEADAQKLQQKSEDKATIQVLPAPPNPSNQFTLQLGEELRQHDMRCMVKSCETLAFLVRDAAHITPDNFELCVRCIRTFVEASINGVNRAHHAHDLHLQLANKQQDKKKLKKRKERDNKRRPPGSQGNGRHSQMVHCSDDDATSENVPGGYHTLSLQLLDLMHTLHTRAASIYSSWAEEEKKRMQYGDQVPTVTAEASSLWDKCWCPLLQGIARLCCDARRQVRTSALTYLQRALLVHDLQTLTGKEWESCFNKVLFPLLTKLLENISPADPDGMEETRMRGATLLSKVFLQHLNPLLSLPTFTALWLTILDFMDKYMHIGKKDLLFEAIPESLKNMLLVMDTAGIFHSPDTETGYTSLWNVTWERIDCFLPSLKNEVFKPPSPEPKKQELVAPKPPEVTRESGVPAPLPGTPFFPPQPKSQLVPQMPPAGIIAAPLPKVTPPASLNILPPANISLTAPYVPPSNPVPLVPFGPTTLSMTPPNQPYLMGPSGPISSPQRPTPPSNILMTPSTPNFIVTPHPPVLSIPMSPVNATPLASSIVPEGSSISAAGSQIQISSIPSSSPSP